VVESKEQAKPKTAPNGMPIAEIPAMLRPHRDGPKTLGIAPGDLLPLPEGPVKNARDRRISPELLSQCRLDGKALWLGCYSQVDKLVVVFDVSSRPDFYGTEGSYGMLAGRDASYPLGAMALGKEALEITDISGLTSAQMKTLLQWYTKMKEKYPVVGYLWPHATGMKLKDPEVDEEDEDELPFHDYRDNKQD
jgi:hypothetical protein